MSPSLLAGELAQELAGLGVVPAARLEEQRETGRWRQAQLAGRLVGMEGAASLTLAALLLAELQRGGEPVAWLMGPGDGVFAPDLLTLGVDLPSLVVVRAPSPLALGRAADRLLRSGAFGLLVLDPGHQHGIPLPQQARLSQFAREHDAIVLCIGAPLGPMASICCRSERRGLGAGRYACTVLAARDRQRGPWTEEVVFRAPAGLR